MRVWHRFVLFLKACAYGSRGEPYEVGGHLVRFVPGTRPVRKKYRDSANLVNRYDALQVEFFERVIKPGWTCLDVGGHHGQCAVLMKALAGTAGQVFSFEPDPRARLVLLQNCRLNSRLGPIEVVPYAVGDADGQLPLYDGQGNSNSSLRPVGAVADAQPISVPVVALDRWVSVRALTQIGLVKLDIEGAEVAALRGARHLLQSAAEFVVELHPYAWPAFGDTYEALQRLVEESGRDMVYLDGWAPASGPPRYGTVWLRRCPSKSRP